MKRLLPAIAPVLFVVIVAAMLSLAATRPNKSGPAAAASGERTNVTQGATLTSDKPDYYPSETVTLTGTGWAPNEVVTIAMTVVPATHDPVTLTSTSDASGNFKNSDYVVQKSDLGVKFYVTAEGAKADTSPLLTFTDSIGTPTGIGTAGYGPSSYVNRLSVSVTSAVTVNNTVIVAIVLYNDMVPTVTVTDSGSNTYTKNADVA